MSKGVGGRLLLAALAMLVPALAQAQSATGFDGSYAGISRTLISDLTRHHNCTPSGGLGPLTIRNGAAQAKWGDGMLEGQVSPQGVLTMRATNGAHFDGQIDNRGEIKGRLNNFVTGGSRAVVGCSYDLTWRKKL